jgi:DNA-binding NarL/FixJ family response regulator
MAQQLTATSTRGTLAEHDGIVLSIELGRRRRSRPSPPGDRIRVLVVGSRALSRAGLRRLLEDDWGLAVVGEAAGGREGARLARSSDPDVVLLDAGGREPDPTDLTRALRAHAAVLLLTDCEADDRLLAALRAGASGVLAMDSHPAELASAVRRVARGEGVLPPGTTSRLIAELADTTPATSPLSRGAR